ncbi:MAG TPA: ATPase [Phycisphaerales bacterium]|nr:ATPase [Phycisphaerales bacterium]HCD31454.1 ATPase [Phycisphaerales bacterium]|tara:strand:+ start:83172 stop:84104 length:933 start_codon:yes stop_codon:yes gene_type:complete
MPVQKLELLKKNVQKVFLGNQAAVDKLIVCLLARGHVLIEDVPGVGKTILATSLSKSLDCSISRVQMTPDLLPGDILGVTIWNQQKGDFIFKPGPIFSNVLLADEINRTTPRTQSALLEAMNEAQVSIDGQTRKLIQPFMVIATQNPFEFEGTYFLPESQLDRFLMRIHLGYPSPEDESRILDLDPSRTTLSDLEPVMTADELVTLQEMVNKVQIDPSLIDYIIQISNATRNNEQLQIGVSPRGSLALVRAARATALMHKRDYVVPDDIVSNVIPVFAHRVISKTYMHDADGVATARVMQQVLETVPSPV